MSNFGNQNNWNGQNNGQNNQNWNNQNNWNDRFGWGNSNTNTAASPAVTSEKAKAFLSQVMGWMFGALLISAALAWAFGTIPALKDFLYNPVEGGLPNQTTLSIAGWIILFLPLVISFVMGFGFNKLSFGVIVILFAAYSAAMGMSLSFITLVYDDAMVGKAFLISSGVFGAMAVAGWVTKADLTRLGRILMIGFVVALVASVLNMIFASSGNSFGFLLDIIFIVIFTGLIAYKVQAIKRVGEQVGTSEPKYAVIEALGLYITFVNLFLTILRLLGRRE